MPAHTASVVSGDEFTFDHASEQAFIAHIYRAPTPKEEDDIACVDDVFDTTFGGSSSSVLYERIREELGLCYGVHDFQHGYGNNRYTWMFTMLDKANVEQARAELYSLLEKVSQDGFEQDRIDVAKASVKFSLSKKCLTPDGYAAIFADRYFEREPQHLDDWLKKVDKVTNADLIEYAQWLLAGDQFFVGMNT